MIKITAIVFSLLITSISSPSYACGGKGIVLNDDVILRTEGLHFPKSEPRKYVSLDIEERMAAVSQCQKEVFSKGGFGAVLSGQDCPSSTVSAIDSNGNKTHQVTMLLSDTTATYVVKDLQTGETKTYSGQLHTRGGCGLAEAK